MGETPKAIFSISQQGLAPLIDESVPLTVETPGGRIQIQWDYEAKATPSGQLAFFAEFLKTSGVYRKWVESCPLSYSSPNAPEKGDVLGTLFLSILAGHNRYTHVTGLRGDGVSREILGMKKTVSEDALRRALARISGEESQAWLQPHLLDSVGEALKTPWILDIDTTIKPLYGKQEGAEVGYNPHKPGRPSHALHTYWVGSLRLVLDVVVAPGNKSSSADTRPGLGAVLDRLQPEQMPALVRGDCGFGNEPFIRELEDRGQAYLFKLRQTKGVQRLLERQRERTDWTEPGPSDQGWSAVEDSLKLTGWDKKRRVVILRRATQPQPDQALTRNNSEGQLELLLPGQDVQRWEYAVLVTNSRYELDAMPQLYRDRADAENGFDELKNQWGWGGFTTQDLERCQTSARVVALIYNWWSWYCRAAQPEARMEAITSRPLLLAAVGRAVKHAGQTFLHLTPMHAAKENLMMLISNVRKALNHVKAIAEQLPSADRWKTLLAYIVARIVPKRTPRLPIPGAFLPA